MKLEAAENIGLNFVMASDPDPKLPTQYVRKDDLLEAIDGFVVRNLSRHNAENFLAYEEIVWELFEIFEEAGVISKKETPVAGDYYRFHLKNYQTFRPEYLKTSSIHQIAGEIGGRYYQDAFDEIERGITEGKQLPPDDIDETSIRADNEVSLRPAQAALLTSEEGREKFLSLIDEAIRAVEEAKLSNDQRATALAHLNAARTLTNQPEPPADLIWKIISRASDLAGIASFFLALAAFFSAAGT